MSGPAFPTDVPTATVTRLSLAKLLAGDKPECNRFMEAASTLGFFYLDLQDTDTGKALNGTVDALFDLQRDLFDLGPDELQKYNNQVPGFTRGYKGTGGTVVDASGRRDKYEMYSVMKDDLLNLDHHPQPQPAMLDQQLPCLRRFVSGAHAVSVSLLDILNTLIGLPAGTLSNLHRLHEPSGDQVRFIKALPQPVDGQQVVLRPHTDFGSLTVLFNRLGGLQVLPQGENSTWCYVKPMPGHAIINIGDALGKLTNGLLRSNLHRVAAPPGQQAVCTRYSLVYFVRPEDDVTLRRLEGSDAIPPLPPHVMEEHISTKDYNSRRVAAATGAQFSKE